MRKTVALLALVMILVACHSSSSSKLALQKLGDFDSPVWAGVAPGDSRIFVVEKTGVIRLIGQELPFLDISKQVSNGNEQGLLSMAFANDWTTSHVFYIDYTDLSGDSHVDAYSGSATRADPKSKRLLLKQDQPYSNHNGGLLLMQPNDTLLIGFGDGGSGGDPQQRAQNLSTRLGKILRLDPARPSSAEIYVSGVRNPWRFSIDPATKDLWIGDVGQNTYEEVDHLSAAGANLGWSHYEGTSVYDASHELTHPDRLVQPIYTYSHSDGSCSITGGVVYRGAKIPQLVGTYLFADICKPALRGYSLQSSSVRTLANVGQQVVSFGVDSTGEVLVVKLGGAVSRLVAG